MQSSKEEQGETRRTFLNEQCLKIEENNTRGKTRDLFRKVGNIKGLSCPKLAVIKDRNGRDLVDVEEMKKRWKEYMEELYKKYLNALDNHDVVVSHSEPDILECEVKQAVGSTAVIKASGYNGIPVELFKTLKDNVIKVFYSICQQIWKTKQRPQDWKRSIFISIPKKGSTKECSHHGAIALISHARNVMLRILHARFQHFVNQELPDVQAGFRKGTRTRDQIANIH